MARVRETAETTVDTSANKKASLSTQVSFEFGSAIKRVASARGTTVSGLVQELVYGKLGLELPEDEREQNKTSDRISISSQVDPDVAQALKDLAETEEETVSAILKQWLAEATDYDLSQEPVFDRAAAMKQAAATRKANAAKATEKHEKTVDILMSILAKLDPTAAAEAKEAINAL